ncbi:hypothetical protein BH09BAC3_BH09BAC3_10950 [soil metagenome]
MVDVVPIITNDAFREIFQSMSEGIIMVNGEGMIVVANPVAEHEFGYNKHELSGMALELLLPVRYRGGHIHFRQGFNAHPEPRKMGLGRDLRALKKDGTEFPVEISLSYTLVNGKLLVMAFISDISARKKSEEDLKRSEEQLIIYAAELEKKVQSRTEDLNVTIQKLEREITERKRAEAESVKALESERELNDLKTKFVAIASHEFRTPLSTILSSVSLVEQYKQLGDFDKIDKHTSRVKSSVQHLTAILNDFLSLGKLDEGKVDVVNEINDIKILFRNIIEEITPNLKSGQNIRLQIKTKKVHITSDPRIVRNVFFNLLSNASKYSGPDQMIFLTIGDDGRFLKITLQDEGIGIPDEDHKHLFERFFRAGNATTIQGTGLGLNIVKRYVELLGGSISFESKFEVGTTFLVSIPLNESNK